MLAVKSLHQASDSNTKPEYFMGHSCQALALLVKIGASFQAAPLTARIHEGLVFSNRDRRTLLDKLLLLLTALRLPEPGLLVAAAYYACGKIIAGLLDQGGHLISRLKKNACAYTVLPSPQRAGRGRPKLYGTKIRLRDLFTGPLATMPSPVYDEQGVTLRWVCRDLLWRPAGRVVRFVAVGSSPPWPNPPAMHRSDARCGRDHPALCPALQNRGQLQAGPPLRRHLGLPFLDAPDDTPAPFSGRPIPP